MRELYDFQVGDLVFIKKRKDWMSFFIRWASKGPYSHVEMVMGKFKYDNTDRLMISANNKPGVHLDTLDRYIKNNVQFDVYRYIGGLKNEEKESIFLTAKQYLNLGYDYSGAIDLFAKIFKHSKNKFYCSELIAQIYVNIKKNLLKNKIQIYPSILAKSNKIVKVFDTEEI